MGQRYYKKQVFHSFFILILFSYLFLPVGIFLQNDDSIGVIVDLSGKS
jgi:hypothetical protein